MEEIFISDQEFLLLSLEKFIEHFPTEESCLKVFPAICRACGHCDPDATGRSFICPNCKTRTFRTAGTFFEGYKQLRPVLARIWLYEDRAVCSKKQFSELFDIAYATAWSIDHKVAAFIEQQMDQQDVFQIVSQMIDPAICKRTLDTSRHKNARYVPQDDIVSPPDEPFECEEEQVIYDLLTVQPESLDALVTKSGLLVSKFMAALTMLELKDLIVRYFGGYCGLKRTKPKTAISEDEEYTLIRLIDLIKEKFHGIGRKYASQYAAAFWALTGANRWTHGSLFKSILHARSFRTRSISASPNMVRIHCLT